VVNHTFDISLVVFIGSLIGTLIVALLGRRDSQRMASGTLSEHRLNRWLVGLSAGATANSGFVVTAAVGLGYTYGVQWLLLPLSWLLGDCLFWLLFPQRINAVGRDIKATTMTDVVLWGVAPRVQLVLRRAIAIMIALCLGGYVSAQWVAGQKFLRGALGLDGTVSLLAFAGLIVVYTAIGGFRGSIYVDSMQALIRIIGTVIAIIAVALAAVRNSPTFWQNIHSAGPAFLKILPHDSILAALPMIVGFAAAALGFGLGQPQMVTRYLAGVSPEETRSA
jgi:sodium/proline symporter